MVPEANSLYQQACSAEYKEDYTTAVEKLQQALNLAGNDDMIYTKLAGVYSEMGEYDKALETYSKVLELKPSDGYIYLSIGSIYENQGKYLEALQAYNKVAEMCPEYLYNYLNIANVQYQLRDYKSAIENYNKFLSTYSQHQDARENLASSYVSDGDYGKAVVEYNNLYSKNPTGFKNFSNYGLALFQTKDYDKACEFLEKAVEANPDNTSAHINLALSYQELNKNDLALAQYDVVFRQQPALHSIRFDYGNLLADMGQDEAAVENYKIYIANYPDDARAYQNIGIVYKRLNQLDNTIANYENAYFESTGEKITLVPGDPIRIFLYAQALREIQLLNKINDAGRQNLLKYARGDVLRNIGAISKTDINEAKKAKTRMKLTFSRASTSAFVLPVGWRVSPANNLFFATTEPHRLEAGETELIITVECESAGTVGNGYLPGQINVIVDPQPYLIAAVNIDETQGGAELEDDDSFKERIYLAPEKRAVAGPEDFYTALVKDYSQAIDVVKVASLAPGQVDIFVLLQNGEIPSQSFLSGLYDYLSPKSRRPMTDRLSCNAPSVTTYDVDFTYYIRSSDIGRESIIMQKVEQSVAEFNRWQKAEIGRDINPSKLTALVVEAGAKRLDVRAPIFRVITSETEVANVANVNLVYGGVEDD